MQVQKVTDPSRAVTDPVMLAVLAGKGVDKDYVELWHDYAPHSRGKGYSPYSKLYRDLNSDQQFMVVSGLPMVDAYGQNHELTWRDKNGTIENGNNIFHAVVNSSDIRIIVLSDQPNGAKKDDEVFFHPQLYIGGMEVQPVSPVPKLLETDLVNPSYHDNVLEWDYGVCRRRLRIIEGRFLGLWVFTAPPGDNILIKYNQRGGLQLRLQYARSEDEEFIPRDYFEGKELPVIVSDSATFYPDANPESTSVDGYCYKQSTPGDTWVNIRDGAGTGADDGSTTLYNSFSTHTTPSKWVSLRRGVSLFDTSSLPDNAEISTAVLSFYGKTKADGLSCAPNINIYSSSPASNNAVVAADYTTLGVTAFCDTAITYSGWSTAGYNNFTLNASGIAAISRTGVSRFGVRNANYDVANNAPAWVSAAASYFQIYCAEQGSGYKPKLVVTYTTEEQKASTDSGVGVELIFSRTFEVADQGSAVETGLAEASVITSDGGSGIDSLKLLSKKVGGDMRLHSRHAQVGLPHKEVSK